MIGSLPTDAAAAAAPQMLITYLERLFEEAHIAPTTEDLRTTMMEETLARLQQHIMLDLLNALPDKKMEDFKVLLEQAPDAEHLTNFLKVSVPNSEDILGKSLAEFKDTFLSAKAN